MESVYSAVRTGALNRAVCASSVKVLKYKFVSINIFIAFAGKRRSKNMSKVLFNERLNLVSLFCYLLTSMIKDKNFYENFITENLH